MHKKKRTTIKVVLFFEYYQPLRRTLFNIL